MLKFFLVFLSVLSVAQAADLPYYNDSFLQALRGNLANEAVKQEVHNTLEKRHIPQTGSPDQLADQCPSAADKCYGHKVMGYTPARQFLLGNFYLVKQGSDYAVREVYCQREVPASEFPSRKPGPGLIPNESIVNTEHTWPQSLFTSKYPKEEQKSDMHHLFPSDSQMNAARGNFDFGTVVKESKTLKCPIAHLGTPSSGRSQVFEPPLQHKGKVARALFYFSVKYEIAIPAEEEATLREWNHQEVVDQEERDRNEAIFAAQGSRNPFIDYPELADKITDF